MTTASIDLKERPILFNAAMVRAILEGRKTQTRRPMKPQPVFGTAVECREYWEHVDDEWWRFVQVPPTRGYTRAEDWLCPYGAPADRLWVRETWNALSAPERDFVDEHGYQAWYGDVPGPLRQRDAFAFLRYRADGAVYHVASDGVDEDGNGVGLQYLDRCPDLDDDLPAPPRWRPSIHMPRWASRLTLEVTDVRVERLQEISDQDARAEGYSWLPGLDDPPLAWFRGLWDEINSTRGFGWDANPWVWVIDFKPVTP